MQVTDIIKSLMSVSRICDTGHQVVFNSNGGFIEHLESELERGMSVKRAGCSGFTTNENTPRNRREL